MRHMPTITGTQEAEMDGLKTQGPAGLLKGPVSKVIMRAAAVAHF